MPNQFGPWATTIQVGSNPQLSAFWKRRMNRLVPVSQTSAVLSRRNFLGLGAAGVLTSALPAVRWASALADEEAGARRESKFPSGRIFLLANLLANPKTADLGKQRFGDVRGIVVIDPETGRWEKIVDGDDVRVSRDGKTLAVAKYHFAPKVGVDSAEIQTCDLANRHTAMVTRQGLGNMCWSPDGKQIVISGGRVAQDTKHKSHFATSRVNLDGSGLTKLPIPDTDDVGDWSSDGQWFVTVASRKPPFGTHYQLYRMHPDATGELRLTRGGLNCYPRFSPDSRHIVYLHQTAKAGNSLHVMDIDGKNDHEVLREEGLASVEAGCFSHDGRHLAVVRFNWRLENGERTVRDPADANFRVEIIDVDGKNRRELSLVGAKIIWLGHPDWR